MASYCNPKCLVALDVVESTVIHKEPQLHNQNTQSSLIFLKRFFSGYSGFPLSPNTNISKFQFDLDYCQALYHEPLVRVITQALPVFDI